MQVKNKKLKVKITGEKLKVKIINEKSQIKSKKCSCTIYGAIKY